MTVHLKKEIEKLKKRIFSLIGVVENNVNLSVKAVKELDRDLAEKIIESDTQVDQMEIDVEEECLKLLALYQPVAVDLRLIVAFMKINSDLERIGDLAVNISKRALYLSKHIQPSDSIDFTDMAERSQAMLRKSIDALVSLDETAAKEVCERDDEINDMRKDMYKRITDEMKKNPDKADVYIQLMSVPRHLERIADHATNICEDLIYMVSGTIVRHHLKS